MPMAASSCGAFVCCRRFWGSSSDHPERRSAQLVRQWHAMRRCRSTKTSPAWRPLRAEKKIENEGRLTRLCGTVQATRPVTYTVWPVTCQWKELSSELIGAHNPLPRTMPESPAAVCGRIVPCGRGCGRRADEPYLTAATLPTARCLVMQVVRTASTVYHDR